jgi:hypothetical protein
MRRCHRSRRQTQPIIGEIYRRRGKSERNTSGRFASMQLMVSRDQLSHQFSQPGWQFGLGAHALLQSFADRIADGPAGPVIDLLEIAVNCWIHDNSLGEFPHSSSRKV